MQPPYLSGLHLTLSEIMELPISKRTAIANELNEMRKKEAAELRKLGRKGK